MNKRVRKTRLAREHRCRWYRRLLNSDLGVRPMPKEQSPF